MTATSTDCRTYDGITVQLIDSVINAARLLKERDLSGPAVVEALKDLRADSDVSCLLHGFVSEMPEDCGCGAELTGNPLCICRDEDDTGGLL